MIAELSEFLVRNVDGYVLAACTIGLFLCLLQLRGKIRGIVARGEEEEAFIVVPIVMGLAAIMMSSAVLSYVLIGSRWWPQHVFKYRTALELFYSISTFGELIATIAYISWLANRSWFTRPARRIIFWICRLG